MLLYALTGTFGLSVPLVGYRMLTLAGFVLVGVPLATAFVWNRLPTHLWIRVLARATMLVAARPTGGAPSVSPPEATAR